MTAQAPSDAPEPPRQEIDPAQAMLGSMRRIAQAIDIRSREISRQTGLTIPQLLVLQAIRSLGQVTTQALSREASMSAATVVAVMDKLEARGLIERYRSATDRRVVHARLTDVGHSALAQAPGLLGQRFRNRLAALPEEDKRRLAEALRTVASLMADPDASQA